MPTLTVYTAPIDTTTLNSDGSTGVAVVGHMYYVLTSGDAVNSFGFAPQIEGRALGVIGTTPGQIYTNDLDVYQTPPQDGISVSITQAQYDTLMAFGQNPNTFGFDATTYQAFTNSCVSFVWAALGTIGVQFPTSTALSGVPILPQDNTQDVATALTAFPTAGQTIYQYTYNPDGTIANTTAVVAGSGKVLSKLSSATVMMVRL